MRPLLRAGWTAITLVVVLGLALAPAQEMARVHAAEEDPPGPDRAAAITVDYTSYEWWLVGWLDNDIACQLYVDHEGLPTHNEVFNACGEDLYKKWVATVPCETSTCSGYYLLYWQSGPAQREISVALPPPVVWVSLEGCTTLTTTHLCDDRSTLVLTGEEPLPNESIDRLEGFVNGEPFTCDPVCQVELSPTDADGMELEFWAWSTYGDSSLVYEARVRVVDAEMEDRDQVAWFVDVISAQWRGTPSAGCSQTWESFPPVGGPPAWLLTPESPAELATDIPYEYLASNLLIQGIADADECADEGFLPNGQVSPCGLEAARPAINDWQDRFDALIYEVAVETGVPAQLLKNLFSRESQFWPGVIANRPEVGLGQMTENGADTTLLWNLTFYEQFCPFILDEDTCALGYAGLEEEEQEMLRGALVQSVDAFCPNCPLSIDLQQADYSVQFFAETLIANCEQTGMIVYNTYGQAPGEVASYEDLWRFTLVNYNAGPGCLILAIQDTSNLGEPLDWEHVSAHLTPVCEGARGYVDDIGR
jgi:hypothetical protein